MAMLFTNDLRGALAKMIVVFGAGAHEFETLTDRAVEYLPAFDEFAALAPLLVGDGRSYSRTSRPAGQRAHKRWKQRRRGGV